MQHTLDASAAAQPRAQHSRQPHRERDATSEDFASTVFIVDDDDAVRDSLALLMHSCGQKTETFATPAAFLQAYDSQRPGCLILDVRMPGMSGLELQTRLNGIHCILPVIFISAHGDVPMAVSAMRAGAVNFVQKPFTHSDQALEKLLGTINEALHNDRQQRQRLHNHEHIVDCFDSLSKEERRLLQQMVSGKCDTDCAAAVGLDKRAADIYRTRLMKKMEAGSRAYLACQFFQIRHLLDANLEVCPQTSQEEMG